MTKTLRFYYAQPLLAFDVANYLIKGYSQLALDVPAEMADVLDEDRMMHIVRMRAYWARRRRNSWCNSWCDHDQYTR